MVLFAVPPAVAGAAKAAPALLGVVARARPIWNTLKHLGRVGAGAGLVNEGVDAYESVTGDQIQSQRMRNWKEDNPFINEMVLPGLAYASPYTLTRVGASSLFGRKAARDIVPDWLNKAQVQLRQPNFKTAAWGTMKTESLPIAIQALEHGKDAEGEFDPSSALAHLALEFGFAGGFGGALGHGIGAWNKSKLKRQDPNWSEKTHQTPQIRAKELQKQLVKEGKKLEDGDFTGLFGQAVEQDVKQKNIPHKVKPIMTPKGKKEENLPDMHSSGFVSKQIMRNKDASVALAQTLLPKVGINETNFDKVSRIGFFKMDDAGDWEEKLSRETGAMRNTSSSGVRAGNFWVSRRDDGLYEVVEATDQVVDGKRSFVSYITQSPSAIKPKLSSLQHKLDMPDVSDEQWMQFLSHQGAFDKKMTLMNKVLESFQGLQHSIKSQVTNPISAAVKETKLYDGVMNNFANLIEQGSVGQESFVALRVILERLYDESENSTKRFIHGEKDFKTDNIAGKKVPPIMGAPINTFAQNFENVEPGIKDYITQIADEDWDKLWDAYFLKADAGTGAIDDLDVSDSTKETLKKVAQELERQQEEMRLTAQSTGNNLNIDIQSLKGFTRNWEGNNFVSLENAHGKVVHVVGGNNFEQALAKANTLAKDKDWTVSHKVVNPNDPNFKATNPDVGGFNNKPLSKEEFIEQLRGIHLQNNAHISRMSGEFLTSPLMNSLEHQGKRSEIQRIQKRFDQAFKGSTPSILSGGDKVIKDALGWTQKDLDKNASMGNQILTILHFLGDAAFAVMNGLGIAHNALPYGAMMKQDPSSLTEIMPTLAMNEGLDKLTPARDLNVAATLFRALGDVFHMDKNPELKDIMKTYLNDGTISHQAIESPFESASRHGDEFVAYMQSDAGAGNKMAAMVKYLAAITITSPEMMGRMLTASFFKRVAESTGMKPDDVIKATRQATNASMHRYRMIDRPAIFSGATGSAFGLFKTWSLATALATNRILGKSITDPKTMMQPALTWALANAAMGGVIGNPIIGNANNAYAALTDSEGLEGWVYEKTAEFDQNNAYADGLLYGLPAAMGWSLASRTALPGAEAARDTQFLTSFILYERMKMLGINPITAMTEGRHGALGAIMDHSQANPETSFAENPRVMAQISRGILPKTFHRTIQMLNNDDMLSLRTGYPVKKDLTMGEKIGYALGFNPMEIEVHQRVADRLWKDKAERQQRTRVLGQEMQNAQSSAQQEQILRVAIMHGIPVESVLRSWKQRQQEAGKDIVQRVLQDNQAERFSGFLSRYENE